MEQDNKRLTEFKRAFKGMTAASEDAYVKTNSKYTRSRHRSYDRNSIDRIVQDGDPVSQAELSKYYYETNGTYKRIILHYATFLTYSWMLVPSLKNRKDVMNNKQVATAYYKATAFLTDFQTQNKCAKFALKVLIEGGYYGLLNDEGKKTILQDLPFDYCRSRFKDNNDIDIVEFNLKFFDTIRDSDLRTEILKTYPKVIRTAYNRFKYSDGPQWVFLPSEMGVYFCFSEERPFFLELIPLLDDLEDYKEMDKQRNEQALKRIIVQKIGVDGTRLVFEPDEAEEMHEGVLDMLQNNTDVDVITTYNTVSLLDLSSTDDEKTEIEDIQNLIYESAGLSKEFFFSTTDTGLEVSEKNDLAMMMLLAQKFAHFFTILVNSKFENKKVNFNFIILPVSYYNSDQYVDKARDLVSFGYSFITPVVATGLDQTSLSNLKLLENDLLNLDDILKPLQTSYTQSDKTISEVNAAKDAEDQKNKGQSNKSPEENGDAAAISPDNKTEEGEQQ